MYRNKLRATSFEEFLIKLREHEIKTSSRFVIISSSKAFTEEKFTPTRNQKLFWDDDVPYYYIGCRLYACHQGKDKNLHKKKKYAEKRESKACDGDITERKIIAKPTKKKDCPAGIRVVRVLAFPRFKVNGKICQNSKNIKTAAIKGNISEGEDLGGENVYFFDLPDEKSHQNHPLTATRKIEPNIPSTSNLVWKCSQCEKGYQTRQQLRDHERLLHNIYRRKSGGRINIKFNTTQEFIDWLHAEEQKMKFHFVKSRSAQKEEGHHTNYYKCNRINKYVSKSTDQCELKTKRSQEIGERCTAKLIVKLVYIDNSIHVTYFNKHDHEHSFPYSPLATSKKVVAEKITTRRWCYDHFLKDLGENFEMPENRCHLATSQDLDDSETFLQLDSYSGGSNSPSSSDIEQNVNSEKRTAQKRKQQNPETIVNTELNDGDRTKLLSELMTVYNKVISVPEISQNTVECVVGVLQNIKALLDIV